MPAKGQLAKPALQNLSKWNPATEPRTQLAGPWDFYYGKLLSSDQVRNALKPDLQLSELKSWDELEIDGKPLPVHGVATYSTLLILPSNQPNLAIQMPFVSASYQVYIDDVLVASSGHAGAANSKYLARMVRRNLMLPATMDTVRLVVQVANYDMFWSGMAEPPILSLYETALLDSSFSNAVNLGIIGGLLAMALYHILIYIFRRKEKSMLYFGLLCTIVMLRFAVLGDHYIYEWLNFYSGFFNIWVQTRAYFLLTYLMVFVGFKFLESLYPADVNIWVSRVYGGLLAMYALFSLAVPTPVFTASLLGAQIVLGIAVLYLVFVIARAAYLSRPDARFLLLGLGAVILAGVHDGLQTFGIYILGHEEMLTFGFMLFLTVQFIIVSKRYSFAFNEVEDLSENLEKKVVQRTHELNVANEEIKQKNQDITDSIEYARRIQLSILPKTDEFFARFSDSFILYLPKDIVSGDFYWMHQDDGRFYVSAADCTGHGVPGAFMSVLGSNVLNTLVYEHAQPTPAHMLNQLNTRVREALKQSPNRSIQEGSHDGMDLALCTIQNNAINYSGANRPLVYIRKGELHELAPAKMPIGGGQTTEALFADQQLQLQPGDCVYLFTDGFTDQFGGDTGRLKKLSNKRFRELLLQYHELPMAEQKEHLLQELRHWQGKHEQTDDILVIGIRF